MKIILQKFIKFGMIGCMMTLLSQGFYLLFIYWQWNPVVSTVLADLIPMPISYILNCRFTYKTQPRLAGGLLYPIAYIPGILLGMGIVFLCTRIIGIPKIWGKIISLPFTSIMNFWMVGQVAIK